MVSQVHLFGDNSSSDPMPPGQKGVRNPWKNFAGNDKLPQIAWVQPGEHEEGESYEDAVVRHKTDKVEPTPLSCVPMRRR